jgi:hypothetical protein
VVVYSRIIVVACLSVSTACGLFAEEEETFDPRIRPGMFIDVDGGDVGPSRTWSPVDGGDSLQPADASADGSAASDGLHTGVDSTSGDTLIGPVDVADGSQETPCLSYGPPEAMGAMPPTVTEASGIVVSASQDSIVWVHNDSGDQPKLYAIESGGARVATVTLGGTSAYDWEDMASGPCAPEDGTRGCLYVGDVGDNNRVREDVVIYRLVEPDVSLGDHTLDPEHYETMRVVYPDEAHDCEALVVDGSANVYLLTKEWGEGVFRLYGTVFTGGVEGVPLQFLSEHQVSDVGGNLPLVTAASFSQVRNRLLVRTYSSAFEYQLAPEASLSQLTWATVKTVPVANEGQGEAIAYGEDGYWHVSEGKEPPIWRILCQ